MKMMIFSYIGPVSGFPEALNKYFEQLDQYYLQDMGDCGFTGYCSSSCQYYGSGCEIL